MSTKKWILIAEDSANILISALCTAITAVCFYLLGWSISHFEGLVLALLLLIYFKALDIRRGQVLKEEVEDG